MKKKLFFIAPLLPYPFDMANKVRIFNILRSLSEKFDITLVCQILHEKDLVNTVKLEEFCECHVNVAENRKSIASKVLYKIKFWFYRVFKEMPKDLFYTNYCGLEKVALRLLRNNRYDVCFFEYWFWPNLLNHASGLKVVDTNDVQYQRYEQIGRINKGFDMGMSRHLKKYKELELMTLRRFDLLVTVTEKDKNILGAILENEKILNVPTGVDTSYYIPLDKNHEHENIISFYGAMGGEANIDALIHFYNDIFPLIKEKVKDAKLIVVGANPSKDVLDLAKKDRNVTVTGYVQDVRPYLRKSKVSVCPMRVGYGIRGRVLELMSMCIPVVATEKAVDGMGLQDNIGILIRNNPDDIAHAVIDILRDSSLHEQMGLSGRRFVEAKYSYEGTYGYLAKYLSGISASGMKAL